MGFIDRHNNEKVEKRLNKIKQLSVALDTLFRIEEELGGDCFAERNNSQIEEENKSLQETKKWFDNLIPHLDGRFVTNDTREKLNIDFSIAQTIEKYNVDIDGVTIRSTIEKRDVKEANKSMDDAEKLIVKRIKDIKSLIKDGYLMGTDDILNKKNTLHSLDVAKGIAEGTLGKITLRC